MADQQPQQPQGAPISISDDILKGIYANNLQVSFTAEEFILDFMNLIPPKGIVNARIFLNPSHVKRIIAVLADTVKKYEEQQGELKNNAPTKPVQITESSKFGF
jgi:hypothetical protein